MATTNFHGLRVLALESRRAQEISKLILNSGGIPLVVPSVRELPLESNTRPIEFVRKLREGGFHVVIFMTGVGVQLLARIAEGVYPISEFATLLSRTITVARGPKPLAALRQIGVTATLTVPEPNTWHDLLSELDNRHGEIPLDGKRVVLQEYGVSNPELVDALQQRGAEVSCVPVYEWKLPEDTAPLRRAVDDVINGDIDVILVTASVQIRHLFQVAETAGKKDALLEAMKRTVLTSIGPLCSEEIQKHGLSVDLEPSHPKMGFLVMEAAEKSGSLLHQKRQ